MKKISLLLLLMFVMTGCNSDEPKENPPEITTLLNTKWKLVGFFDIEKNELIEPMAKDCDSCYTISFQWDSTSLFPSSDKVYFASARGLMVDVSRVICYDSWLSIFNNETSNVVAECRYARYSGWR